MKPPTPIPSFPLPLTESEEPTQPHRFEVDATFEPPHLVQVDGQPLGAVYRLERVQTTIGRDRTANIQLRSPQLSRLHACIATDGNSSTICDLESDNGTFVNGQRVVGVAPLANGDLIDLGGVALFRFAAPRAGGPEDNAVRGRGMLGPKDRTTGTLVVGLFHSRYLDEFVLAHNHGLALSLLVVDVVAFSRINVEFGKTAGDTLLREVASRLTATTRRADFVTRWNADQFLVLCRCNGIEAEQLAHRLVQAVQVQPFILVGSKVSVAIAVGVAAIPDHRFINAEGLFGAAINAVCDAKGLAPPRVILR